MAEDTTTLNEPRPLPTDLRTVFLGGVFIILLLGALRTAAEIAMPVVLAFVLKLVLQPVLRFLEKLKLPRAVASLIVLATLVFTLFMLGTALSGPAASWVEKLPSSIPRLQERLGFLSHTIDEAQQIMSHAEDLAHGAGPQAVPVTLEGSRLSDKVFTGTRAFASGLFTTMLVLFFLLASGDTFLRKLVEVLPRFSDKRQAVDLSQQIEQNISIYLLTITVINAGVGVLTGLITFACGFGDPLLWGMLAFLMNYVPILGAFICASIFILVGLLATNTLLAAMIPAALYLLLHFIEATFITPLLLARRFTLNPVLVILSLIFWYWMWGLPGAMLAVPMLTIAKIICDRIQALSTFGHFLGG